MTTVEKPFELFARSILLQYMQDFHSTYRLSTDSDVTMDINTIERRLKGEGFKFALVTLKEISDALLEGLEIGTLPLAKSFKTLRDSRIPVLFRTYWTCIFHLDGTRRVIEDNTPEAFASIMAAKFLYQIGNFFPKMDLPYPEEVTAPFIQKFVETDRDLGYQYDPFVHHLLSRAANVAGKIIDHWDLSDLTPRHGPGAVFGGQRQEEKWDFTTIFLDMDTEYDSMTYFYASPRHLIDRLNEHSNLKWADHSVSKFMLVPKTVQKPRGICIEPLEKQFIQQGQMSRMVQSMQTPGQISFNHVNFANQQINRELALHASSGMLDFATIDLSDASDTVSMQIVRDIFRNHGKLFAQICATRSTHVLLPDGRKIKLNKFAPMGSSVCFPMEALVFYSVCVAAISIAADDECWLKHAQRVYVYGDDILVPCEYVEKCILALEMVGFKVNTSKSYWKGNFRESCGMHAYKGVDITPTRVSKLPPVTPHDGSKISSWLSYARAFDRQGFSRTAELIYTMIEKLLKRKLPFCTDSSGVLGRYCDNELVAVHLNSFQRIKRRWSKDLQTWVYLVPKLIGRQRDCKYSDEWDRLLSNLLTSNPDLDPSKTVLRDSVKIHWIWTPMG